MELKTSVRDTKKGTQSFVVKETQRQRVVLRLHPVHTHVFVTETALAEVQDAFRYLSEVSLQFYRNGTAHGEPFGPGASLFWNQGQGHDDGGPGQ